jgi:hypothetical protein
MPSSFSASLRFELQFTGENTNTWGVKLNTALSRVDFAVAGRASIALSGTPYILTVSNLSDDEARASTLEFTGVGTTVTIRASPRNTPSKLLRLGSGDPDDGGGDHGCDRSNRYR